MQTHSDFFALKRHKAFVPLPPVKFHKTLNYLSMKKSLMYLLLGISSLSSSAYCQELIDGNKFFDNWSIGIRGGAITPLTHGEFFKDMRPAVGIELSKQITPGFGLGIEGMGYINTEISKTAFDASNVSLLGKFNLMNLLSGYNGVPRVFELEAVVGAG